MPIRWNPDQPFVPMSPQEREAVRELLRSITRRMKQDPTSDKSEG